MDNLVEDTFKEDGLLAQHVDNYNVRTQQIGLAKKIREVIAAEKGLLAEAPTGSGKSIASLVPAFEYIKKNDEPVIVVTSSILLQSQYMKKDIPALEKMYDFNVSPVLIKGRNNYVCAKKLRDSDRSGQVSFYTSDAAKEYETVKNWAIQTKTGDKEELDFNPSHEVWSQIACVSDNECTGKGCPLYHECHYYRQRNKVASSKLLVCNYHYFFHGLDNEKMLPPNPKVLILDEGHEISSIGRDFQERKHSLYSFRGQFDHFLKSMQRAEIIENESIASSSQHLPIDMELDQINHTLNIMISGLTDVYKRQIKSKTIQSFWRMDTADRKSLQHHVLNHLEALEHAITTGKDYMDRYHFEFPQGLQMALEMYGEDVVEWLVEVHHTTDFLANKHYVLKHMFLLNGEKQDDGDDIFWLQQLRDSVSIHAKPTTAAELIGPLFHKDTPFIPTVMSATLSANRSFHHLKKEFGIEEGSNDYPVDEMIVSSPFNLNENLLWYLPEDTPNGNDPEHLSFALRGMRDMIIEMDGRTLCLFTSNKNMNMAETYLQQELPSYMTILMQSQLPKKKIIDTMLEKDHCVIIATKSFFTGVDIQGSHLSAVLMDKIPFPMIGDPINDYLMSQPRGFFRFALPEATLAIKQGVGRLNRTTNDKGIVAVYDGRLSTAKYKNRIFNSFDFKIQATKSWNKLQEYTANLKNDS